MGRPAEAANGDRGLTDCFDAREDGLAFLRADDLAEQAAEEADVFAFGSLDQGRIGMGHSARTNARIKLSVRRPDRG